MIKFLMTPFAQFMLIVCVINQTCQFINIILTILNKIADKILKKQEKEIEKSKKSLQEEHNRLIGELADEITKRIKKKTYDGEGEN